MLRQNAVCYSGSGRISIRLYLIFQQFAGITIFIFVEMIIENWYVAVTLYKQNKVSLKLFKIGTEYFIVRVQKLFGSTLCSLYNLYFHDKSELIIRKLIKQKRNQCNHLLQLVTYLKVLLNHIY